ncbi:carbohydrate sulfotransferase 1 isoform X2 [Eucyclogobius newberryi]|uniref:carbohydrate sulfotransferase 1 isoform X1 n=1 Tax=Eucyclogobius newberryi TaxID=166745 RepID=UPI003B5CACCF
MQCSWKSVVLLALASVAIQYTAIRSLTSTSYLLCPAHSNSSSTPFSTDPAFEREDLRDGCDEGHLPNSTRRTQVLLLTTTRCGSTFIGQLLNQHPDIFYLFEPLYHVQASIIPRIHLPSDRQVMLGASRDLLWSLFQCDLYALESYIRPAPTNHMLDNLFRHSASRTLCQQPVCQAFKPGDTWEEWQCKKKCHPLNLTLAAQVCRKKPHVALKTVRVPVVGDLRPLLADPRLNIKVIQLVRDPRGILSSRIETFRDLYRLWGIWQATGRRPHTLETRQFTTICDDFYSSVSTALSRPAWLRGRYMLVRYEDLSRSPLQKTKEIYDFVGLAMTPSVEEWIRVNTRATNDAQAKDKFGTMRDSAANAESWRLKLPLDMVEYSQGACQRALRQLGYREVQSADELRNMNISLVQEKTFVPFL